MNLLYAQLTGMNTFIKKYPPPPVFCKLDIAFCLIGAALGSFSGAADIFGWHIVIIKDKAIVVCISVYQVWGFHLPPSANSH